MAGALGIEPRLEVLETPVLPLYDAPSQNNPLGIILFPYVKYVFYI